MSGSANGVQNAVEVSRPFGSTQIQLVYADCDPAGIVYYATWFSWMERLLSVWWFDQGFRSDEMLDRHGFATITRHAECEYLAPVKLLESVEFSMISARIGSTSIKWQFEVVRRHDLKLVARGKITLVIIDGEGKPRSVPDEVRQIIIG